MEDKKDVVALQAGSARLCAEVDFAIDEQLFNPFVKCYGDQISFAEIKEAVKKNNFKKHSDSIEYNGCYLKPFAILPSVICACQIDNVEVVNKSVIFDCDKLALCVEYIVCLKFFDKDNKPQCQEFKACFTKKIDRDDFSLLPPFGSGPPTLEDFLTAEGTCVSVVPMFTPDDCMVVSHECLSMVFLNFPFEVLVKLFRTHNVTVATVSPGVGLRVQRIPKEVDRCNFCFPKHGGSCSS